MEKGNNLLKSLEDIAAIPQSGFGSVTINFKDGNIVYIEKKEIVKIGN